MWDFSLKLKSFWYWGSAVFRSVFASGAIKLFRAGLMTESSCARGAVSGVLFMCPSGWGVVEKVPLIGVPIIFSQSWFIEGFQGGRRRSWKQWFQEIVMAIPLLSRKWFAFIGHFVYQAQCFTCLLPPHGVVVSM